MPEASLSPPESSYRDHIDAVRRRLWCADSANAVEVRLHTERFARAADLPDDFSSTVGMHTTATGRLGDLLVEEGQVIRQVAKDASAEGFWRQTEEIIGQLDEVVQRGSEAAPKLLAQNRKMVRRYNNAWTLSRYSASERHKLRRALTRIIFELDRMYWLAIQLWAEKKTGQKVVGVATQHAVGEHERRKPTDDPLIRNRVPTSGSDDTYGKMMPEELPPQWASASFPANLREPHSVRHWISNIQPDLPRLCSSDEAVQKVELYAHEAFQADLADAFLAVETIARHLGWSDPPRPAMEYVILNDAGRQDQIQEVQKQLDQLVDWINAKLDEEPTKAATGTNKVPVGVQQTDEGVGGDDGASLPGATAGSEKPDVPRWESKFSVKPEAAVRDFLEKCGVENVTELELKKFDVRDLLVLRVRCGDDLDSIPNEPPAPREWMSPAETRDFIAEHFGAEVLATSTRQLAGRPLTDAIKGDWTKAGIKKLRNFRRA